MRSLVVRVALYAALLAALGAGVAACGSGASVRSAFDPARMRVAATSSAPLVVPHGAGHETYDLGGGVRVFAYWNPGKTDVPWAIDVHGGSWRYGSGADRGYLNWARHEATRGWAGFTVDYRLVPSVTWPAPEHDVERAIDWIRAHSAKFGLAPQHGFIIGHSAGGQLASIAALQLGGFAGAASISGAVDPYYIYRYAPDHSLRHSAALLVGSRVHDQALWQSTRAESYLGEHVLPFLVMHSADDPVVPEAVARAFAVALHAHRYPTTFVEVPGGEHDLSSAYDNSVVDNWMDSVLAGGAAATIGA